MQKLTRKTWVRPSQIVFLCLFFLVSQVAPVGYVRRNCRNWIWLIRDLINVDVSSLSVSVNTKRPGLRIVFHYINYPSIRARISISTFYSSRSPSTNSFLGARSPSNVRWNVLAIYIVVKGKMNYKFFFPRLLVDSLLLVWFASFAFGAKLLSPDEG